MSKYTLAFKSEMVSDVKEVVAWYESQKLGLGKAFAIELGLTIGGIASNPALSPYFSKPSGKSF